MEYARRQANALCLSGQVPPLISRWHVTRRARESLRKSSLAVHKSGFSMNYAGLLTVNGF